MTRRSPPLAPFPRRPLLIATCGSHGCPANGIFWPRAQLAPLGLFGHVCVHLPVFVSTSMSLFVFPPTRACVCPFVSVSARAIQPTNLVNPDRVNSTLLGLVQLIRLGLVQHCWPNSPQLTRLPFSPIFGPFLSVFILFLVIRYSLTLVCMHIHRFWHILLLWVFFFIYYYLLID